MTINHSLCCTAINQQFPTQMPSGSIRAFEDPSDLEMDDLAKPKCILRLNSLFDHSNLLDVSSAPSWHFLLILSLLLWYPLWFLSLLCLCQMILPLFPSFLLTHYFLHVYNPRDHIIWERTPQKSGGECTLSG